MASAASQLLEEVTAHAQSDSIEDAREIWADGTYFPNNLRKTVSDLLSYVKFSDVAACLSGKCVDLLESQNNVIKVSPCTVRDAHTSTR